MGGLKCAKVKTNELQFIRGRPLNQLLEILTQLHLWQICVLFPSLVPLYIDPLLSPTPHPLKRLEAAGRRDRPKI